VNGVVSGMGSCRRTRRMAASTAVLVTLAGCAPSEPSSSTAGPAERAPSLSHVHGLAFDTDGGLLVATHVGLLKVGGGGDPSHVGPAIDLMGFTVAGPDRLLASGHPGPGVDLPEPVGLIESVDGGETWEPVSRQGQSDFHALTVGDAGIVGHDGSLVRSTDGVNWQELQIPAQPAALAASPTGSDVLATTEQGLLHSPDGGSTWSPVAGVPVLQTVAWAEDGTTVVGVEPSGTVWTSADGAAAWRESADLGTAVQAVAVSAVADGGSRMAVATDDALVVSEDGGRTFDALLEF
jgi:hypothetical protein